MKYYFKILYLKINLKSVLHAIVVFEYIHSNINLILKIVNTGLDINLSLYKNGFCFCFNYVIKALLVLQY